MGYLFLFEGGRVKGVVGATLWSREVQTLKNAGHGENLI